MIQQKIQGNPLAATWNFAENAAEDSYIPSSLSHHHLSPHLIYTVWVFVLAIHWWRWLYSHRNVWILSWELASAYQMTMSYLPSHSGLYKFMIVDSFTIVCFPILNLLILLVDLCSLVLRLQCSIFMEVVDWKLNHILVVQKAKGVSASRFCFCLCPLFCPLLVSTY